MQIIKSLYHLIQTNVFINKIYVKFVSGVYLLRVFFSMMMIISIKLADMPRPASTIRITASDSASEWQVIKFVLFPLPLW